MTWTALYWIDLTQTRYYCNQAAAIIGRRVIERVMAACFMPARRLLNLAFTDFVLIKYTNLH